MRSIPCSVMAACMLLAWAAAASAARPTDAEMAEAHDWLTTLTGTEQVPPRFSFTCAGKPFAEIRRHWTIHRATRKLDDARTEHTATFTDPGTGLELQCRAVEFADHPTVEWVLYLRNTGQSPTPIIENIRPLDAELVSPGRPAVLHYSLGDSNSADSFAPREKTLPPDDREPFSLAPGGGRSSDPYLPFFNLAGDGRGIALAVGWSGQWEARFERTAAGGLRAQAGQQLTHLSLAPGESIRTPRMLLAFWQGPQPLRGSNLIRRVMIDHYLPRRDGAVVFSPICASVNWTAPDGSYEGPHLEVITPLAQRGIEVYWSDMDPQHWYPGDFPNGTGTWEPDPKKYPRGLKPIGDAVHAAGLRYLLWFEPERVAPGTRIDREHPEWIIKVQDDGSRLFRLHDEKARHWLTDLIDRHVTEAGLSWVRWDFNIEPLGFWRSNDPPDRQGITENRHIEGLYAMWDELMKRHPGLIIDNCASGGRRIDLETCTRGLPLWHSDMQCSMKPEAAADQLQNAGLFRWVPMHGCGNFAYEPDYTFRSAMTAGNILAHTDARGRVTTAEPDTADAVRRTVAVYKKVRPFMLGDFYPLFPHVKNDDAWFGYQFHRDDMNAGMAMIFRRAGCANAATTVGLNDIDPAGRYEITCQDNSDKVVTEGRALQSWPVTIDRCPGSTIIYYRKVNPQTSN